MVNCFIALNIIYKDTLLNDNPVPIIFYWDGVSNIKDDIKNNEAFMKIIKNKCLNIEKYSESYIAICYINEDNSHEYGDYTINIEDLIPFNEIKESDFMYGYVSEILYSLYKKVFKIDYVKMSLDLDDLNSKNEIKDIIVKIREHIKRNVSNDTIINYIYSELDEKYHLASHNKDWLKQNIKEILEES